MECNALEEFYLEGVVSERASLAEGGGDGGPERVDVVQRCPAERRFGRGETPGLVRHAAQREPRRADAPAFDCDRGRRRDQRELIGLSIADLQIVRGAPLRASRDLDRDD